MNAKLALQLPSVVTAVEPTNVAPPKPDGSLTVLEKNSIVKVVLGVLLRVPPMVVPPENAFNTGKFCRLFAPVSPSHESLSVTPFWSRSIPRPSLEKIKFCRRLLLVAETTMIPVPRLNAIMFPAPGLVPPTVLLEES